MRPIHLLFLSFILWTCGSPDIVEPEEIDVNLNGEMKAFLQGNEWNSGPNTSASVNYDTDQIHIEGYEANDGIIRSHITIIVNETSTGTYNAQTATGIYYDVQTKSAYISSSTCFVDILAMDIEEGFINGEFSFVATNLNTGEVREIQSGEFENVNLTISE